MVICFFAITFPVRQAFSLLPKSLRLGRGLSTQMSSTISEKDKYLFDLNGYIVIRNVLTVQEIASANAVIDRKQDLAQERMYVYIYIHNILA
jgi:hypothetical protein